MNRPEPIGLLIAATRRRINQITAAAIRRHRLSPQQFWTVIAIARNDGLSLGELADRRRMDDPTACRVVDALVRRRLVRSAIDPGDRRRTRLALTEPGHALAAKLLPIAAAIRATVEATLGPEEREVLVTGLRKLLSRLDRQVESLAGPRRTRQRKAS